VLQFDNIPKHGEMSFTNLFTNILNYKRQQGDVLGLDDATCERLQGIARTAFRTYVSIRDDYEPSSSSQNHTSLVGGSSTHPSSRKPLGTKKRSKTTGTAAATSTSSHRPYLVSQPPESQSLELQQGPYSSINVQSQATYQQATLGLNYNDQANSNPMLSQSGFQLAASSNPTFPTTRHQFSGSLPTPENIYSSEPYQCVAFPTQGHWMTAATASAAFPARTTTQGTPSPAVAAAATTIPDWYPYVTMNGTASFVGQVANPGAANAAEAEVMLRKTDGIVR